MVLTSYIEIFLRPLNCSGVVLLQVSNELLHALLHHGLGQAVARGPVVYSEEKSSLKSSIY